MRARSRRPAPERAPPLEVRAPPSHRWGSPERGSTPSGRRQTLCQGPKERAQRPRGNMTAITKITNAVKGRVPSAPVLIGGVYCLCVLAIIAITAGSMLVTDEDPFRSDCPVEEVVSTGVAGTTALVVGVLAGLALVRSPGRARLGAIVFGALAITLSHSSGRALPGIFGAVAVWLARLTRGRRPLDGASRVFGVIGLCVAILNPTVVLGGELLHLLIVFVS
jgi:hypothetical protein